MARHSCGPLCETSVSPLILDIFLSLNHTERTREKRHFVVVLTDELIPDNITFTETNGDPHAAAAICSGSKPKGCNIEVVRPKIWKFSILCSGSWKSEEGKKSWKQRLRVFRVYRSLNRCHNNAETSNPWKATGCCLAITEAPTASRQITEAAVLFLHRWWSPGCLLCISQLHPAINTNC